MVEYMTTADVGRILSMSKSSAARWLKRKGVIPLSLGVGRGLGLRWSKIDVEAAIAGAQIQSKDKEEKNPRRPPLHKRPLVGRSLAEQLALISGEKLQ